MPRMRYIKPGFFTNDTLADIAPLGRLLFAGLWCLADKAGRLEDRPKRIKAEILPYDNVNVDALLNELARLGFIERYQVGSARLIQISRWEKHQHPHHKEVESELPGPDMAEKPHVDAKNQARAMNDSSMNQASTVLTPQLQVHEQLQMHEQRTDADAGIDFIDGDPQDWDQTIGLVALHLGVRGKPTQETALRAGLGVMRGRRDFTRQAVLWVGKLGDEVKPPGRRVASFIEWMKVEAERGTGNGEGVHVWDAPAAEDLPPCNTAAWRATQPLVAAQLRGNFCMYFSGVQDLMRFGMLVLRFVGSHECEWVERFYGGIVHDALSDAGYPDTAVSYEVAGEERVAS